MERAMRKPFLTRMTIMVGAIWQLRNKLYTDE